MNEPFEGDRRVFDYLPDGVSTLSTFRFLGVAERDGIVVRRGGQNRVQLEPGVRPVVGARLGP